MANQAHPPLPVQLAHEIRGLYRSDTSGAGHRIENFLGTKLEGLPTSEKLAILEGVHAEFKGIAPSAPSEESNDKEMLSDLFSLLLGQRIANPDLASTDLSRKVAESLNTVFDSLNELVGIISSTLEGEASELDTIRHIISADIRGGGESKSLENYLNQIKEAFLIANEAFRVAARNEVNRILTELDPERIASEAEKGIRFGFMRKAELFDVYREKFGQIKKWFDSERFIEEFSREFERTCQKLYSEKGE